MKIMRLLVFPISLLIVSASIATARVVSIWSYQELLDKSDLVVIATPTASNDTQERNLPGFEDQPVVGVETRFKVSAVIKGDQALKDFVLHHYRSGPGAMIDGPSFVYFGIAEKPSVFPRRYILFLHREADGRYAPVVGQADPGLGIMELEGVYESAVTETQTKLGIDLKNVLEKCQTIKPGMTRAELSKVFTTEGGLSTPKHRTYVYHDCPYVKVDVDFAPSSGKPATLEEKPGDIIASISKPYLDWTASD
jgi:hypothetical protein